MDNAHPLGPAFIDRTVDAAIRLALIAALIGWCFVIARPFLVPVLWGAIIAITVSHGHHLLEEALGGKATLAAVLVTILLLIMLVVPSILLGGSLVTGVESLVESFHTGQFSIPPPPEGLARLPVIGEPIARFWSTAHEDLGA